MRRACLPDNKFSYIVRNSYQCCDWSVSTHFRDLRSALGSSQRIVFVEVNLSNEFFDKEQQAIYLQYTEKLYGEMQNNMPPHPPRERRGKTGGCPRLSCDHVLQPPNEPSSQDERTGGRTLGILLWKSTVSERGCSFFFCLF